MTGSLPNIRYAPSDGLNIAYQVLGEGPVDIVLVPGFVSHIEFAWQQPLLARFLRRLSEFARVIAFDKRGMGHSDHDPRREAPSMDERVRDIAAVMAATDSSSAALLAWSEGGPAAVAFAHEHPQLTDALLLLETTARFTTTEDFDAGIPREVLETFIDTMESDWGTGVGFEIYAPSLADDVRAKAWWASYQRFAATPGAVAATLRMQLDVDVRSLLPTLTVPTLVFHREYDMVVPVECGRYLAARVPGARYIEAAGEDHMYWAGDQDELLRAIRALMGTTPAGAGLSRLRRSHRAAASGWDSLTISEMEIARLVAEGWTNDEIGGRLRISPRTVQTHVTHILRKLGARRRTDIAVETVRRQH